jgi:amino acid transporter
MSIAVISSVVLIAVVCVGLFVVRRVARLALRLVFIGVILLVALIGAFVWWYQSGSLTTPSPQTERRSTTAPRRPSNSSR